MMANRVDSVAHTLDVDAIPIAPKSFSFVHDSATDTPAYLIQTNSIPAMEEQRQKCPIIKMSIKCYSSIH